MKKKTDAELVSEKAKAYFNQGFNWAESISLSFKDYLRIKDSVLPQLASGFGGGMGHKGSVCGALTGAVMAIGMKIGRSDPKDRKTLQNVYDKCQRFWDQFEKEFGNVNCFNITGIHLDNEEERQKWLAAGGREKCADLVERTATMLCGLLSG